MLHTGGGWGETPLYDCKALLGVEQYTIKALYKWFIHSFNATCPGTVWERPFYIPEWLYPRAQSKVHNDMVGFVWKNLTGPHRALTSTPLNLWDELEQAFSSNISGWLHKCSFGWIGNHPHRDTPKSCGKPFQRSGRCYSCKVHVRVMVRCPKRTGHIQLKE